MKYRMCFQKTFFVALTAVLLTGCGTARRISYPYEHTYLPTSSKNDGITKEYPKSFTVYPFMNISWDKNAGIRARRAVFESFSFVGICARMDETDKLASVPYNFDDAMKVAREQKTDAVVIGKVINQEQSFLLLYAYNYIELQVTVYDTRNGLPLYTATGWSMSNEFGGMIFWIPNPILPMIENIFWSRVTMDLYHRITMDMVNDMRPDLLELPK
ncbi:MAG: hypothetical protein GXP32_04530 [Kiritimatiellaeota bacterium]|nr:hypothetical protein [Kiritimatiellota bacterium]